MKGTGLEKRIESFAERLTREDVNLYGFLLSVGGKEKAGAFRPPFTEDRTHRMYSVSKTMVACAIGMLMEEGKLRLEDHITDYFQDLLPDHPSPCRNVELRTSWVTLSS